MSPITAVEGLFLLCVGGVALAVLCTVVYIVMLPFTHLFRSKKDDRLIK